VFLLPPSTLIVLVDLQDELGLSDASLARSREAFASLGNCAGVSAFMPLASFTTEVSQANQPAPATAGWLCWRTVQPHPLTARTPWFQVAEAVLNRGDEAARVPEGTLGLMAAYGPSGNMHAALLRW